MVVTRDASGQVGVHLRDTFLRLAEEIVHVYEGKGVALVRMAVGRLIQREDGFMLIPPTPHQKASIKSDSYWGECLVHVSMARNKKHHFMSSCFGEKLVQGRGGTFVVKDYLPLEFPRGGDQEMGNAEGLTLVTASQDRQEVVMRMQPGATFRMHRDNDTAFRVHWNGRRLFVERETQKGKAPGKSKPKGLASMGDVFARQDRPQG